MVMALPADGLQTFLKVNKVIAIGHFSYMKHILNEKFLL